MNEYYCGINKVPKGKRLGTAKECMKAKQIRYYGLSKVDKKIFKEEEDIEQILQKEELKRVKLGNRTVKLMKDFRSNKLKAEFAEESGRKAQLKAANKRMDEIRVQAIKIKKQIKQQDRVIKNLEKKINL
jgi:hypothetical protein